MGVAPQSNEGSPSTTWAWKKVRITPPAEGHTAAARRASFEASLARRNLRKPLPAVIKLRGGEECWVEVQARGRVFRFPGYVALYDVLRSIARSDL